MKRVLITGAGGFLGKNLVRKFLQNENLYVMAMTSQTDKIFDEFRNERLQIVKSDDTEIDWKQTAVLIHAAFPRGNNSLLLAQGMQYHASILEQAVKGGVGTVINISSQSVYDKSRKTEALEQEPVSPKGDYAVAKYASELVTNSLCRKIPHTNIRLASLVGPGLDVRIVNKFIKQILEGGKLHIKGGKQQFELMDVKDAADGLMRVALSNPEAWKEVYNFGNGIRYELLSLAECVVSIVHQCTGLNSQVLLEHTEDWMNSALNSEQFHREFDWKPHYTMEDTIREITLDLMKQK